MTFRFMMYLNVVSDWLRFDSVWRCEFDEVCTGVWQDHTPWDVKDKFLFGLIFCNIAVKDFFFFNTDFRDNELEDYEMYFYKFFMMSLGQFMAFCLWTLHFEKKLVCKTYGFFENMSEDKGILERQDSIIRNIYINRYIQDISTYRKMRLVFHSYKYQIIHIIV